MWCGCFLRASWNVSCYFCLHLLWTSPIPAFVLANHFIRWPLAQSLPKSLSAKENFLLQRSLFPLPYHHQIMLWKSHKRGTFFRKQHSGWKSARVPEASEQPSQTLITGPRRNDGHRLALREETQEIEAQKWDAPFSNLWFVGGMWTSFLWECFCEDICLED